MVDSDVLDMSGTKVSPLNCCWPVISTLVPNGPGEGISLDFCGHLLTTSSGTKYLLLVTNPSRLRAAIYPGSVSELSAVGAAKVLVIRVISRKGVARSRCLRIMAFNALPRFLALFVMS